VKAPQDSGDHLGSFGMLRDWNCRLQLGIYCLIALTSITVQELVSLFVMTPSAHGGLDGEPADIGRIFSVIGVCGVTFEMFLGPPVVKRLGLIRAVKVGLCTSAIFTVLTPFVPQALPASRGFSSQWRFGAITALQVVRGWGDYFVFSSVFVLVNNSVPANCRGRVNGLATTVASIFKAAGPAVGTALFACSLHLGLGPPLDIHLLFLVVGAVVATFCVVGADRIPAWATLPYDEQPGRAPDQLCEGP